MTRRKKRDGPVVSLPPKGQHQNILLFDIENAPNLAYVWGVWEQNAIKLVRESFMLSFAYSWYGTKQTHVLSLRMYDGYDDDRCDDFFLVRDLHTLFDVADVVVAHNAKGHDIPYANARWIKHRFSPPKPYKVVDTLQARRAIVKGKANHNNLDYIGEEQGYGRKLKHQGFELWEACMNGDKNAWKTMERYNKQDVVLLEKWYTDLRGWMPNHPKAYTIAVCKHCDSNDITWRGERIQLNGRRMREFVCKSCRHWGSVPKEMVE